MALLAGSGQIYYQPPALEESLKTCLCIIPTNLDAVSWQAILPSHLTTKIVLLDLLHIDVPLPCRALARLLRRGLRSSPILDNVAHY